MHNEKVYVKSFPGATIKCIMKRFTWCNDKMHNEKVYVKSFPGATIKCIMKRFT